MKLIVPISNQLNPSQSYFDSNKLYIDSNEFLCSSTGCGKKRNIDIFDTKHPETKEIIRTTLFLSCSDCYKTGITNSKKIFDIYHQLPQE